MLGKLVSLDGADFLPGKKYFLFDGLRPSFRKLAEFPLAVGLDSLDGDAHSDLLLDLLLVKFAEVAVWQLPGVADVVVRFQVAHFYVASRVCVDNHPCRALQSRSGATFPIACKKID